MFAVVDNLEDVHVADDGVGAVQLDDPGAQPVGEEPLGRLTRLPR
jgi:hypothetical protein